MIRLLAYLLAENCYNDDFTYLIGKHEELFAKEKEEFNHFKTNHDVHVYSEKKENYTIALRTCMEYDLEDLAM